jgi:hypothetical protein
VSSTKHSASNFPIILWAEEGLSTSYYRQDIGWGYDTNATQSIRCARNLGLGNHPSPPTSSGDDNDDNYNIDDESENVAIGDNALVQVKVSGSGADAVYTFNLMNVNETSLRRVYYERELPTSDENSKLAAPYYKGFMTGGTMTYSKNDNDNDAYITLRNLLDNGGSPNTNILNDGYRVPNMREAALMSIYCNQPKSNWWSGNNYLSTTYFSYGTLGQDKHHTTRWLFGNNFATLDAGKYASLNIRFVKDIE